jgi:hypothetical protein
LSISRLFQVGVAVISIPGFLYSQTVSQGVANPNQLRSPMVVDTVFAPALDSAVWIKANGKKPAKWNKGDWFTVPEYHDLGNYTCDGVSLRRDYQQRRNTWDSGLEMRMVERNDQTDVTIRVTVTNPKYVHDKMMTLTFEVLEGTTSIKASAAFKVEEEEEGDEKVKIRIPTAALITHPAPTLRITITTMDY